MLVKYGCKKKKKNDPFSTKRQQICVSDKTRFMWQGFDNKSGGILEM